jgi:hypothetical protein
MCYTAGIDDNQVGLLSVANLMQPELSEQFTHLLAFVLVDFAAEAGYGEILHNLV